MARSKRPTSRVGLSHTARQCRMCRAVDREHLNELVRRRPFEPLEISLTDERTVVVRHPEQVIVTGRHVIFGLAQVKRDRANLATSKDRDAIAKDWMLVDLLYVVSVEPMNGNANRTRRKRPPRKRT